MPSIEAVASHFYKTYQIEGGQSFLGTVFPPYEGEVPSYDFSTPRLLLRTPHDTPVTESDVIVTTSGKRFMVGRHGESEVFGDPHYKVFRLYQATHQLVWERENTYTDDLTGLEVKKGMTNLGTIWATVEMYGRLYPDRTTRIAEDTSRMITNAAVQLGDYVDGRVINRISFELGLRICEIQ